MPMVWIDEGADIDQANVDKLFEMVVTPTRAVMAVTWLLTVIGILLIAGSVLYCGIRK